MLLNFIGGVLLTAAIVVNVNALISALQTSLTAKLVAAAAVGLWIGTQVSLATAGAFGASLHFLPAGRRDGGAASIGRRRRRLGLARVSSALVALPMPLLIGLNFSRIFGAFFLLLAADGRMGRAIPVLGGLGRHHHGRGGVAARHPRGPPVDQSGRDLGVECLRFLLDLVAAVVLGTISFNGGLGQLIVAGAGSNEIQFLPWSLIPTVLAPFYLIVHGIIFAQLRREVRSPAPAMG